MSESVSLLDSTSENVVEHVSEFDCDEDTDRLPVEVRDIVNELDTEIEEVNEGDCVCDPLVESVDDTVSECDVDNALVNDAV